MKQTVIILRNLFLIFIFVLSLASCKESGNWQLNGNEFNSLNDVTVTSTPADSGSTPQGGISTGNPVMLSLPESLHPDLDSFMVDSSYDGLAVADIKVEGENITIDDHRKSLRMRRVMSETHKEYLDFVKRLKKSNDKVLQALKEAGITEITEGQPRSLTGEWTFLFWKGHWRVEVMIEPGTSDSLRVLYYNHTTNQLAATSLLKLSDNGVVEKGLFLAVDPRLVNDELAFGVKTRYLAFAYDFKNSDKPQFLLRRDFSPQSRPDFVAEHVHFNCHKSLNKCHGLRVGIRDVAPQNALSTDSLRFDANYADATFCAAKVDYSGSEPEFNGFYQFDLKAQVLSQGCLLSEAPTWHAYSYQSEDLPCRFLDQCGMEGSTAESLIGDGRSPQTWLDHNIGVLEAWLNQQF